MNKIPLIIFLSTFYLIILPFLSYFSKSWFHALILWTEAWGMSAPGLKALPQWLGPTARTQISLWWKEIKSGRGSLRCCSPGHWSDGPDHHLWKRKPVNLFGGFSKLPGGGPRGWAFEEAFGRPEAWDIRSVDLWAHLSVLRRLWSPRLLQHPEPEGMLSPHLVTL